jgi:hypothetical protein
MCRQPHSNAKLPQTVHCKIPRREPWGKERSANKAFCQAQRAFRKHNLRRSRSSRDQDWRVNDPTDGCHQPGS